MRPLNLQNEFMNWADFLHADSDAIMFGKTNTILYIFDLNATSLQFYLLNHWR